MSVLSKFGSAALLGGFGFVGCLEAATQAACGTSLVGDIAPPPAPVSAYSFGFNTVLSGDGRFALTSALGHIHQGVICGAAWLLDLGTSPAPSVLVLPGVAIQGQLFGYSLAIDDSGDTIAVSGPGGSTVSGRVRVLRRIGGAMITSLELAGFADEYFGRDVALSADGKTLVISATNWDGPGFDPGAIFTYDWNGTAWIQGTPVYPSSIPFGTARIGGCLELSADAQVLAFNAPSHWMDPVSSGAVYVMRRNGTGWAFETRFTDSSNSALGDFGKSIALSCDGSVMAVGSPLDSRLATHQGAVAIFRRSQTGWTPDVTVLPTAYAPNSLYGSAVGLNATGTHLIVGSPGHDVVGRVEYLTSPSAMGSAWALAEQHNGLPNSGAACGRSVSMAANGERWLVGEPFADNYGTNSGRVLVFETPCLEPNIYCAGQTNSLGCVAGIEASGTPSVSSASGFVLSARNVRNQQNGMLIYSTTGRAQFAWQGGTLCVAPPLRRTPLVNSGGAAGASNDCSGVLSRDFNSWAISAGGPALIVGQQVRAQFYSRDPGAVANVNLSNAIEFTLEP